MKSFAKKSTTEVANRAPLRPDGRLRVVTEDVQAEEKHLRHVIEHAGHLLPAQGPITVFIHHNTLHAFEDLPFFEAVEKGAQVFGCEPYLSEERYREELGRGRVRVADVEAVLCEDLGPRASEPILRLCTRLDLRLAMLQYPLRYGPTEELLWFVAETDALRRVRRDVSSTTRGRFVAETRRWVMRDLRGGNESGRNGHGTAKSGNERVEADLAGLLERFGHAHIEDWNDRTWEAFALQSLWRVCCTGIKSAPECTASLPAPIRHADLLRQLTGQQTDLPVHDLLISFCAAYLDQGVADWPLPNREQGFYRAFVSLHRQPLGPPNGCLGELSGELARLEDSQIGPLGSIRESLCLLGVPEEELQSFVSATLLALPGWAGMVHQIELRGDRVRHPIPSDSLIEFLAIRLILDRLAVASAARSSLGFRGSLSTLRDELRRLIDAAPAVSVEQRAFQVFQLAQVFGWTAETLSRLRPDDWTALLREIEGFSAIERRRFFHLAYERRFVTRSLDAVALHAPTCPPPDEIPRFQAVFCLDDREESMRRHLEEVAPDVETFGIAGFYGVAIYYRGAADAHFVPLCPIVIRPQHWITEHVVDGLTETHQRRARARRALGTASHRLHVGSRTFALGALVTATVGVLATAPLVARILFPRLTARIRNLFGRLVQAPPVTELHLERSDHVAAGPQNGHVGYSLVEMTEIGERQLRDIGLTQRFARLVFLIGHGSLSLNNPHKSAYDCGACGGAPGAPNGRALARILNDPRIRERLAQRGLNIPGTTVFIGGFHNTCDDSIALFETDRVPDSHRSELEAAQKDLEEALNRNAHERCRRFMSAPLTMSFAAARQHVQARAEDLAQTRPELGHATNAICFVGRRERTRQLFFDRRIFLTSYDPTHDDAQGAILTRLLQAAVPVCSGISLEYYFSHVDSPGFGCGTKLSHNVTALLGVMDGAASDLRTGLPWQMVEIHEPVRLLFVLETTPEVILGIMERHAVIGSVLRNGWALLAVLDPYSQAIQVYRDGRFTCYEPEAEELPQAASSVDWYRGCRDHLDFAEIGRRHVRGPASSR
ncbi:MAG: DUF2309 domain-containing protein [Gemmataceae bacterium]|nr:DUF2309 domain-containing protein [Gemmataceae bacterium]